MPIDMVQRFIVEVDTTKLLKRYLRLAMLTALNSHEELAVKVVDPNDEHLGLYLPSVFMDQDKHFPVIFIGGWYWPEKGEKNFYFGGYKPYTTFRAVDTAVQHIKELFQRNKSVERHLFF